MKNTLIIMLFAAVAFTRCKKEEKSDNPFFNKYDTPFEVPPFEQIKAAHFMPAYLKGFEEQKKEIKKKIYRGCQKVLLPRRQHWQRV